ncbi:MAG: hypothetical protein NTY30_00425 [Candidatus Berkelbacteria bacterium]|nr:hypothetical protein [Candidatus Berkelbacteria bacterium]
MTNIEVGKIEDRVIGGALRFLAAKRVEKEPSATFDVAGFRSSAKKLRKSWKEKDANSDTFRKE